MMCCAGGAVVSVLICKVKKKVLFMQSLFVMILQLFSPFASAVQSDSVRRPIGFRSPSNRIPFATYRLLMSDKVANHAPSFRSEYRFGVELYAVHIVGVVS